MNGEHSQLSWQKLGKCHTSMRWRPCKQENGKEHLTWRSACSWLHGEVGEDTRRLRPEWKRWWVKGSGTVWDKGGCSGHTWESWREGKRGQEYWLWFTILGRISLSAVVSGVWWWERRVREQGECQNPGGLRTGSLGWRTLTLLMWMLKTAGIRAGFGEGRIVSQSPS